MIYVIIRSELVIGRCFLKESAKSRRLHGNVSYTGTGFTWVSGCVVKFLCGLHGLHGSKYFFYVGQHFTWVIVLRGLHESTIFFRWSKFFACDNFY